MTPPKGGISFPLNSTQGGKKWVTVRQKGKLSEQKKKKKRDLARARPVPQRPSAPAPKRLRRRVYKNTGFHI